MTAEKKKHTLRDQLAQLAGKWTRTEDVCPIKNGGYSIAMLVYRRVSYSRLVEKSLGPAHFHWSTVDSMKVNFLVPDSKVVMIFP